MSDYYDQRETRSADERAAAMAEELPALLVRAMLHAPGMAAHLEGVNPAGARPGGAGGSAGAPEVGAGAAQKAHPPLGGFAAGRCRGSRMSSRAPGRSTSRGCAATTGGGWGGSCMPAALGAGTSCRTASRYHLTPAGMIFENGARAVGAAVLPAGTGQTEAQVEAARDVGGTVYAGTPDFLKVILDKADEMGVDAGVHAGRRCRAGRCSRRCGRNMPTRGIVCRQCYATADLGLIAYESAAMEGMIVDEGVIVEIVRPGTGDPVPEGEVGEVVVTSFNPDYPLIRFATGDLSAVLPGQSPCGRTNMRIRGWMGRADQTAKIKGMFVRPEQVAALVARHPEVARARVVVTRDGEVDAMAVQVETSGADAAALGESLREVLKLRGAVEIVAPGSLPNDGKVIDDRRSYD